MVTYLSMRTAPVTRSISTPQKSKMKPWQSDELISSFSVGGVSSGGVQNTVSRSAWFSSGDQAGRPVAGGGEPRERNGVVGIAACACTRPPVNSISSRRNVELRRGRTRELRLDLFGREMGGAADRGGEAARIIAGRDRPGVACGVELGDDADVGWLEAECVGNDLRQHRAMALTLRHRGDVH